MSNVGFGLMMDVERVAFLVMERRVVALSGLMLEVENGPCTDGWDGSRIVQATTSHEMSANEYLHLAWILPGDKLNSILKFEERNMSPTSFDFIHNYL